MLLLGRIPNTLYIAFSGGIDSVVVTHFLKQSNRSITLLHFNHGTEHGKQAEDFSKEYAYNSGLPILLDSVEPYQKGNTKSKEEYWRNARYSFLESVRGPVLTCHHLDDQIETWLFSSLNNYPKLIPYRRNNIVRPFLLVKKEEIVKYATKHNLKYIQDNSNYDTSYPRNRIRHNIVPEALQINPGLHKVIARKVREEYNVKEK